MEKEILQSKISQMIAKIETLQDFIKITSTDMEMSERSANEMLRLTNEAVEIGIK